MFGYFKAKQFYVLHTRYDHKDFFNIMTDMLKVFHVDVYSILDLSDTLSFISP